MQRNLSGLIVFTVILFSFFTWSCTKIDTTTLGAGLIPAIDNVTTFADTLDINCTQGIFDDSTKLARADLHVLGSISNDPVFGKTSADLFFELKPSFFPFYFGAAKDTIDNGSFDSVVLCLSYKSFYGDTALPQHLSVYQVDNSSDFSDTVSYKLDYHPTIGTTVLGSADIYPTKLRNYTYFYPAPATTKDSINNQIRIKLTDPAFLDLLTSVANRDTSIATSIYKSDSLFKEKFKGFAVVADAGQGNGLFYVNLTDAATRLEFHFKRQNNNKRDTTFSSFYFSSGVSTSSSAHANHLERKRNGAEYNPPTNVPLPATNAVYIQTTPGTYANLSIPKLATLPNSIIHRAEIFVEQIGPTNLLDDQLTPPLYLYLDLIDTASGSPSKPIYYDLNPTALYYPDHTTSFYPNGGIDFNYFGGYRRVKAEGTGSLYYYTFNVSRYVQHIVTDHVNNYTMKLSAPYNLHYQGYSIPYKNNLANGRIKVGSGSNPGVDVNYRMKMRIVYSKI